MTARLETSPRAADSGAGSPVTARPAAMSDSVFLAGRHLRLMVRRPSSVIGAVVLPVVFAVLFFTVFGRVMDRAGIDYAQYLVPAVVVQSVFFAAISGSIWAAEDAASGMTTRLRSMPIARVAPISSLLIGETVRAMVGAVVLIGVGHGFGFRFQAGPGGVVAFLALTAAAALAIVLPYLILGFALANPESTQAVGGLIFYPLLLVSTLFVPAQAYPGWLRPVVENQPLSQIAEALRVVSTSGAVDGGRTVLIALAWMVGSLVLFGLLAPRVFGRTS